MARPKINETITAVKRGHRVLEDHRDLGPAHQPHFILGQLEQVAPTKDHFAIADLAGGLRNEAHNRERVYTLAAAAFSYYAEGFALVQRVGDSVHGVNGPFLSMKLRFEVFYLH